MRACRWDLACLQCAVHVLLLRLNEFVPQSLWRENVDGKAGSARHGQAGRPAGDGASTRQARVKATADKSVSAGSDQSRSAGMMVTRSEFIALLKSVPKIPAHLIESWFDALALRFAQVNPPPAELTLDFRRLLAAAGA